MEGRRLIRNVAVVTVTKDSTQAPALPGILLARVANRMCSPRRSAITEPSIESQIKSNEASSSDQINGR